jgi:hypothetical protein
MEVQVMSEQDDILFPRVLEPRPSGKRSSEEKDSIQITDSNTKRVLARFESDLYWWDDLVLWDDATGSGCFYHMFQGGLTCCGHCGYPEIEDIEPITFNDEASWLKRRETNIERLIRLANKARR